MIAAVETGEDDLATEITKKLLKKFPKSDRTERLHGMLAEAQGMVDRAPSNIQNVVITCLQGDYSKALFIYTEVLSVHPTNLLLMKRKVALYKSIGDRKSAMDEIHMILEQAPHDVGSWLELANLHITEADIQVIITL